MNDNKINAQKKEYISCVCVCAHTQQYKTNL